MSKRLLVLVALLALSACQKERLVFVPKPSAFAETAAICDSSGIEGQYLFVKDKTNQLSLSLEREPAAERKIKTYARRLSDYSAEIDAQYRTVTSSCKAYARCMEMNRYDEGECTASAARWRESERDFTDLARDLREIEAEVIILTSGSPHKKYRRVNKCEDGVCY